MHVDEDEAGLKGLAQEGAAFGNSPFDGGFYAGDLDVEGVWDVREEVKELAD